MNPAVAILFIAAPFAAAFVKACHLIADGLEPIHDALRHGGQWFVNLKSRFHSTVYKGE